eukprot:646599-Prorocentrum_lima.AAC.1
MLDILQTGVTLKDAVTQVVDSSEEMDVLLASARIRIDGLVCEARGVDYVCRAAEFGANDAG